MPRRDPFKDIEELFEQLNAGFADVSEDFGEQLGGGGIHVDVADTGEELVVSADVPGFDTEDIDVSVKDRQLTIAAEHSEATEAEDEETHYYRRERTKRAATRTVTLPAAVDESGASASYEHGVLTVTLPKRDADDGGVDIEVN
jgi:HSP20 family protein